MSETELSKSILDAVNLLPGVRLWRVNTGQRGRMNLGASRGTPDLIGYAGGLFVGLECKTKEGLKRKSSTTEAQRIWRLKAGRAGAHVFVVTSAKQAVQCVQEMRQVHDR